MKDHTETSKGPADGEVGDALEQLAGWIDAQRYPGTAWRRRRRARRLLQPALAAAAAAVAIFLLTLRSPRAPQEVEPDQPIVHIARQELNWRVPTDVRVSVAANVPVKIPLISVPWSGSARPVTWRVPTISFTIR